MFLQEKNMRAKAAFDQIDKFIFSARCSEDIHIKSFIGALGIRKDGAIIRAINGSIRNSYGTSNSSSGKEPVKSAKYHAEGRLLNKIDSGGIIYVARRRRDNGERAMARPCIRCQPLIRNFRVDKVFYSIDENYYGIWIPATNTDKIIMF